jgi:hypothetical protein
MIFVSKGQEVTGGRRKLDNEEPHALFSTSNVIRFIKSSGIRWACHVASIR